MLMRTELLCAHATAEGQVGPPESMKPEHNCWPELKFIGQPNLWPIHSVHRSEILRGKETSESK